MKTRRKVEAGLRTIVALAAGVLIAFMCMPGSAAAQARTGFTIQRYEPTAAGQWSFWVDRPRYHERFDLAAGLSFNYGHQPLLVNLTTASGTSRKRSIISDQLYGHLDVAATWLGRLEVSLSLPAALFEAGSATLGIEPGGFRFGDPRIGALLRFYGDAERDPFSVHVGTQVWIPIGGNEEHVGDRTARCAPRVVLAGSVGSWTWSALVALLLRGRASIGQLTAGDGNSVGSEMHVGVSGGYRDRTRRFALGPEAYFATTWSGGHAFKSTFTSLEILLGGHYEPLPRLLLGAAAGIGALREPGSPDARVIVRAGYAPVWAKP